MVTPEGSVLRANLVTWSQADPNPPLGITLVLSYGRTPVLRTAEGLWLPGGVPTPFWLLGAKRAGSAQTPLVAVDFDPVLPRVETTNFPKSSLSAAQHSTRARDPVNHNSPETSQRQPQPSAKSKFRISPACRTQASAH